MLSQSNKLKSWMPTSPAITMISFTVTQASMAPGRIHSPAWSTWASLQSFARAFTRGTQIWISACACGIIAATWNDRSRAWCRWGWCRSRNTFLTTILHTRCVDCIRGNRAQFDTSTERSTRTACRSWRRRWHWSRQWDWRWFGAWCWRRWHRGRNWRHILVQTPVLEVHLATFRRLPATAEWDNVLGMVTDATIAIGATCLLAMWREFPTIFLKHCFTLFGERIRTRRWRWSWRSSSATGQRASAL